MRNIFNFIMTMIILWVGNAYFSEYIQISDNKTILLATIFIFVIGYIYALAIGFSVLLIPVVIGCLTIIPLILMGFVLIPIKLYLLDKYLLGFNISGFWTYVVLTVMFSIFSISAKSKSESKESQV